MMCLLCDVACDISFGRHLRLTRQVCDPAERCSGPSPVIVSRLSPFIANYLRQSNRVLANSQSANSPVNLPTLANHAMKNRLIVRGI